MKSHAIKLLGRSSVVAMALAAVAPASIAWAQDGQEEASTLPETEEPAASQGDAIVVTGSRIARSTFTSSTPVTVIGGETIEQMGQVNIGETLQLLPQNVSTSSDTNFGLSSAAAGGNYDVGAQIANLRGLNPRNGVRTLTLVNTKRFVPSTTGGGVDGNLIPSMLVQSVETVTGGASAAYGTDALAGVVNIILDTQLQGIKAQVDYGETFRGDGSSFHVSLAGGTDFAGGAGHTIFGIEYQDSGEVGDCVYVREWCAKSPDIFVNSGFATNGLPAYIRGENGAYTNYDLQTVLRVSTQGNRTNPPGIRGLVFTEDGSRVIDYDPGDYVQSIGFGNRQGGDCLVDCSAWSEVQLRPEVERWSAFWHTEYELSPGLTASLEASYGKRKSSISSISLGPSSGTPLRTDNFFLQNAVYFDRDLGADVLLTDLIASQPPYPAANGGASQAPGVPSQALFIAKHFRNVPGGRSHFDTDLDTWRVMASLEGDLGDFLGGGWSWDAYYQYGKTKQQVDVTGIRVNKFFIYALDAVDEGLATTGVANGNVVCRATLPGPANTSTPGGYEQHWNQADAAGCVPLNILGRNTEDPAAVAYAFRDAHETFDYDQHVAAINFGGNLFDGWAGPIGLAFGGEYRFEKGLAEHTKLPFNVSNTNSPFGEDFGGSLKILEGYVETNIPLLADVPMVKYLELNGAWRHTYQTNADALSDLSKSQHFDTWKISGTWDVTDWLRFRATRSRDVRAASFVDLYFNSPDILSGPPAGTALNPWNVDGTGAALNDFALITYPPNPGLSPEIGNTFTAGVVLQPGGFMDGLRLSVDYYDIKISDAIVVLTTQQVVDACFKADVACGNIFNGSGTAFSELSAADRTDFETIVRGATNVGRFQQSGWDVELLYTLPLQNLSDSMPGTLTLRGLATITDKMQVDLGNGSGAIEYVNQTGGSAFGGFTAPSEYILNGYATYDVGGFSITADFRYIPDGIYDIRRCEVDVECASTNPNSINSNVVDSRLYTGLSTSYEFQLGGSSTAEIFLSIRNLFDVDPPNAPSNATGSLGPVQGVGGPTNPVFYDTLGARWRTGLRVKF